MDPKHALELQRNCQAMAFLVAELMERTKTSGDADSKVEALRHTAEQEQAEYARVMEGLDQLMAANQHNSQANGRSSQVDRIRMRVGALQTSTTSTRRHALSLHTEVM
jgi:hypothetical protein